MNPDGVARVRPEQTMAMPLHLRLLAHVALAAVGGIGASYVVAGVCALRTVERGFCWSMLRLERGTGRWCESPPGCGTGYNPVDGGEDMAADVVSCAGMEVLARMVPGGVDGAVIREPCVGPGFRSIELAVWERSSSNAANIEAVYAGWPRACCMGAVAVDDRGAAMLSGAVRAPESFKRSWNGTGGIVPVRPMWRGLAINTAIYGSGLWMVWMVAMPGRRFLVRSVRARGGRCVGCGYSREGLALGGECPECGKTR